MKDNKARIDLAEYKLRSAWYSIKKMYHEEAKKYGVTHAIGFALLSIHPKNGTPSTSIGPIMGMEANSLSRILKTMEENKLILRKPNPDDGRGILIYLTDNGKVKRDITKEKVLKFNCLLEKKIGKSNIKLFHKISEEIKNIADEIKKVTCKNNSLINEK